MSRAEVQIEQQEDDQQRERDDHLQPSLGSLQVLELPAPRHVVAGRERDAGSDRPLCFADVAAEIAVTNINIDVRHELAVLGPDRGRHARKLN